MPLVGLQCVIMVFPDHNHLLFGQMPNIKGNEVYNKMLVNDLPLHTPWTPAVGSFLSFLKVVMLHITLRGMKHKRPCKELFCLLHTIDPWGGVKSKKWLCCISSK